jgi:hypothetical protein
VSVNVVSAWRLSGHTSWRESLTGKIVVRVHEERKVGWVADGNRPEWSRIETRWRDAELSDMTPPLLVAGERKDGLKIPSIADTIAIGN